MEQLRASMAPAHGAHARSQTAEAHSPHVEPGATSNYRWGPVVFSVALLLVAAAVGLAFLRPDLLKQGLASLKGATGQEDDAVAGAPGPPFEAEAASRQLVRIAESASTCAKPGQPSGSGSARVRYATTGFADKVTLAPPFAGTDVGRCLETRLLTSRVAPFGGVPVEVTKSFLIRPPAGVGPGGALAPGMALPTDAALPTGAALPVGAALPTGAALPGEATAASSTETGVTRAPVVRPTEATPAPPEPRPQKPRAPKASPSPAAATETTEAPVATAPTETAAAPAPAAAPLDSLPVDSGE